MKYYNYTDLGITSSIKPRFCHLLIETDSEGTFYACSIDDHNIITKTIDKGESWATVETRTVGDGIVVAWHDRSNEIIYWALQQTGNLSIECFQLDYGNSDTITEFGTIISGGGGEVFTPRDIFMISTNLYMVVLHNDGGGNYTVEIYKWTDPNWVLDATWVGSRIIQRTSYVVVIGSLAYMIGYDTDGFVGEVHVLVYSDAGNSLTSLEQVTTADDKQIGNPEYRALAYDGSDMLYWILLDYGDTEYYLYSYSIGSDTATKLGLYNISLMLDRNTASGVLEKAFHVSEYKIYQLQEHKTQLNLIAVPDTGEVIIAITDNFFITTTGKMFEYEEKINSLATVFIHHQTQEASFAVVTVFNNAIPITTNMMMKFLHEYTTAGVTSEEIVFEGVIEKFSEGKQQKLSLRSPAKRELKKTQPSGDYTKDSDGLMSQLITDYNDYVTAGTLTDGAALGTFSLGGQQTEETIFDDCAEFEAWIWYLNPTGQLYFNNGTTDSTINYTEASGLSGVVQDHVHEEYNKIKVIGAYVAGVQAVSDWKEDLDSQQRVGINKKVISITILNTDALCNTAVTNLLVVLAKDPKRVVFSIRDTTAGYIQVGETITFEYSGGGLTITSDQYLITSAVIDKYGVITYTIVDELT